MAITGSGRRRLRPPSFAPVGSTPSRSPISPTRRRLNYGNQRPQRRRPRRPGIQETIPGGVTLLCALSDKVAGRLAVRVAVPRHSVLFGRGGASDSVRAIGTAI